LQTYGFAEAVLKEDSDFYLIGTSYYNYASPLVRYNTNDIIGDIKESSGILSSFKITKGREGEFVLDFNNQKISLTGLIYGRHHKIFDYIQHLQICQTIPGHVIIYYVSSNNDIVGKENNFFNCENVNITFSFKKINEPIKTQSGKVNLLVRT
jgi:Coenzyme F390 synthetase